MLTLIVLLSLASFRVTRFLVRDTLISAQRDWVLRRISEGRPGKARVKLFELLQCPYCLGIWISGAMVVITMQYTSVPLPVWVWLAVASGSLLPWQYMEH